MLSERHNYSSQNPLISEALRRAIERRRGQESRDPVLLARRAGLDPDPWQSELLRARAKQMVLLCSRQSGKSAISAILALDEALYHAPALVLLLSPSLRQSQELFRKVKDAYNRVSADFPVEEESALRIEFANGSRVVCLPGKEASIRGFSAVSLLVVDEAARVDDGLYQAIRPMLAVSGGRIILLSTPFGKRGFFHEVWHEGGADWHRTKITARECPRISPEWLEAERKSIGDFWYEQEYLCEFKDDVSSVFRYEDVAAAMSPDVEPLWELRDALRN